ncbi:methylenetetrahydrofolate reductase [NAD(P)H] [Actibacterium sp. 188UL27-1]|uniref:methylenetetrahydrofolate reductase [NAD(P)H] n=1 Tax=Actibacterium sp. 188UL27-1 TaxID=2786961 RepID=UPI00195E8EAA|nr:methylenetetrahydrofolate reductase [NAD(P)H] [Actibacterium sp. 188UL27-1]MBM7068674.1 methylenetetrahydrofolate reductase [NAD(P)H] [Actibacterium sp. 188UL27-1]
MPAPSVSFEFFPPKSVEASFRLHDAVQTLAPLGPEFVSVTYGAGGTTRTLTQEAAHAIHSTSGLAVAAHLTCVDASREETLAVATDYAKAGITQIVALRGDPPAGQDTFTAHPDGFTDSCDLIRGLRDVGDFTIRVGAYPDIHPEAASDTADLDWLKAKIDAGAHEAITQFFFEADTFFRFRDAAVKAGITAPILPGILPIENWTRARAFAKRCGAKIPVSLDQAFQTAIRDDRVELLSVAQATELCSDLLSEGVEHLHFYTLNRPSLTRDICQALGLRADTPLAAVA